MFAWFAPAFADGVFDNGPLRDKSNVGPCMSCLGHCLEPGPRGLDRYSQSTAIDSAAGASSRSSTRPRARGRRDLSPSWSLASLCVGPTTPSFGDRGLSWPLWRNESWEYWYTQADTCSALFALLSLMSFIYVVIKLLPAYLRLPSVVLSLPCWPCLVVGYRAVCSRSSRASIGHRGIPTTRRA